MFSMYWLQMQHDIFKSNQGNGVCQVAGGLQTDGCINVLCDAECKASVTLQQHPTMSHFSTFITDLIDNDGKYSDNEDL